MRNFDRGRAAFEKEQIGAGMLWMIESWRAAAAAGDLALQRSARANLSAWLPYHPRINAVFSHRRPVQDAAFSPDGKIIITCGDDRMARFWNAETGLPMGPTLEHPLEVNSVAFSPDGKTVVTGSMDGMARLWDTRTRRQTGSPLRLDGAGEVSVAFSPNGKSVLTGRTLTPRSQGNMLRLWDAVSDLPLGPALRNIGIPVAFSADGKSILVRSGPAPLWDAATLRPVFPTLRGLSTAPRSVALSPDGKTLLTGSNDGWAQLWDAATGQAITPPLKGHDDRVRDVAFSPDGELFLTASTDKTARLWDALTGQPIGLPLQHQGAVVAVAFSPDGKSFLTTSSDFTVRLWRNALYEPIGLVVAQPSALVPWHSALTAK